MAASGESIDPQGALPAHPYYPTSVAIPGFIPNDTPVTRLLPIFAAAIVAFVGPVLLLASRRRTKLRPIDRFAVGWFALCGFLHVAFEGYYLYYREDLVRMSTPFAQLWKEYALSDSRYLTNDAFTISVETITALFWGPLSLLTVLNILKCSPHRHTTQLIVCTAHLYGVALYYLTNYTEYRLGGVVYSRPETLYFWVYYVGFNLPWAVVPAVLLVDSGCAMARAFGVEEEGKQRE